MLEKILLILLVNIIFFSKTLCFKYTSDDIPVYQNPPKFKNTWHKILCWIDGRYRSGPQVDHILTTIIHALIGVCIYLGFGKNDISLVAALFFSLNPTNNQASVWISGRAYALATLGMTSTLAFPLLWGIPILIATYTNAGFFAPVALLGSKYPQFILIAPLAWWINWSRFRRNVKHKMDKEMLVEDKAIKIEKAILVIKTFGFYTMLTLIPFQNSFYHSFLQSSSGTGRFKAYSMKDRFFWIGCVFALAMGCYVCTHKWDMISFGLLWWCVCLAPFCNLMRMSQEIAERYCYLPSVGLMFVLATVLINHPVLIGVFLTMYAVRLWFLMDMYQDDYYLLEHSCVLDPSSWFVWHVRGMRRWEQRSYQEAIIIWSMARLISPNEFKVNFNLATAVAMAGHKEEAEQFLQLAQNHIPEGQEDQTNQMISEWKAGNMSIVL